MSSRYIATTVALAVAFAAMSAGADEATPSTNDANRTNGWAHVEEMDLGVGTLSLKFISTRNFASCFEYRSDGDENERLLNSTTNEPLDNFNPEIDDGLYPFHCENNSSSDKLLFATDYVEVRMVFGAERDERFDWTRFDVAQMDASKADCKDGQWETYGFKNQGQCVRYIETGFDSR